MKYGYPFEARIVVHSSEELQAVYAALAATVDHTEYLPDSWNCREDFEKACAEAALRPDLAPISNSQHTDAAPDDVPDAVPSVDSAGVPFDPDLHTGTLKKDGTWRVKKGKAEEAAALVEEVAVDEPEEEVDEFAAFKEAAAQPSEPIEVPARTWTDADLGQLCNDAAVKLSNPVPVKELIAKYVPEGEVAHSRNIPNDQREVFAQEVEAVAGIEYAG